MAEELRIENELHSGLRSTMDFASARAQANRKALLALMAALRAEEDAIRQGGGAKAGGGTAREGAADGAGAGEAAARSGSGTSGAGGVGRLRDVCGIGRGTRRGSGNRTWASERAAVMIVADDATVKAGAFFPMTAKKVLRAQPSQPTIAFRRFTLWTQGVCFCRCRRTCFRTPTILDGFFAITR